MGTVGGETGLGGCLTADDCVSYLEGRPDAPSAEAVQIHIDGCRSCRLALGEVARTHRSFPAFSAGASGGMHTLADGERIGERYDIRRFIARGGMGEVYEAFDLVLGERVALKTLVVTALDQERAVERLLAEVRLARQVSHANVCRILELGVHRRPGRAGEAIPFLTMTFLEGETLAQRVHRAGRLGPAQALPIVRGLGAGLGAIHRAGIIHRDFKSENVFLVPGAPGEVERAIVMDFGLARAAQRQPGGRHSTGQLLLGTPEYMAPEQVEGAPVTPAIDVYALGIVMFEMLTGRLPFTGDSPTSVALARLSRAAPSPSSLAPDVDRAWDLVVGRCLQRDPLRRPAGVESTIAMLDLLLASQPRRRRRRRLAALLGGAALAAAIGGVVTAVRLGQPRDTAAAAAAVGSRAGASGRVGASAPASVPARASVAAPPRPEGDRPPAPAPPPTTGRTISGATTRQSKGSTGATPSRASNRRPSGGPPPAEAAPPRPTPEARTAAQQTAAADPLAKPDRPRPKHNDDLFYPF